MRLEFTKDELQLILLALSCLQGEYEEIMTDWSNQHAVIDKINDALGAAHG